MYILFGILTRKDIEGCGKREEKTTTTKRKKEVKFKPKIF